MQVNIAEYIAEHEEIEIMPNIRMNKINLIGKSIGPFQPLQRKKVPLWFGLMMKKKNKATIIPPSWLSVEKLKDNLQQEQTQSTFSELPFHYLEIAQMLLKDGGGDIIGSHQIRTLLSDIRELRGSKMRQGLQSIDEHYLQMNNISKMEIESIREFFQAALNEVRLITVQ